MKIRILNFRRFIPLCSLVATLTAVCLAFCLVFASFGDDIAISASAGVKEGSIIILDPGHGGEDCGAIGVSGVYEKNLNLEIATEIGRELEKRGYIVVYTRTDDRMLYAPEENIKGMRKISDLKGRVAVAKKYEGALFISIHMNSFGDKRYSGLQVYSQDQSAESRRLAEKIQENVKNDLQPKNNRKVKGSNGIYVLQNIENTSVLIECGFLSNEQECENLSQKEYQKQLSFSIVCGIIEYKNKSSLN